MTLNEFKIEVLPLKNKMYRLALRILNDDEEAKDTTQEVMLRIWSRNDELSNYRSVEAFAMTMTRNLSLDKIKSKRWQESSLDNDTNYTQPPARSENYETKEMVEHARKIIDDLPEQQKIIIHLRDFEGYEFEEIADITDLSLNNIRVILSRARKNVRDKLLKIQKYEYSQN